MNCWNSIRISEEFHRSHLFHSFSSNFQWLQWNSTGIPPEEWKDFLVDSERVRAKWFGCEFKLGFLQLICKTSLIFKLNLELPLSIILKERELYESKRVAVECRYLKIWDLLPFLICSSILILKYISAILNW